MGNIIDYVRAQKSSFAEKPLNRVDSLVFSWLAYYRFTDSMGVDSREGAALSELARESWMLDLCAEMHDTESSITMLKAVAESPRFADVRACLFRYELSVKEQKQFSAICFELPGGLGNYVAYRGTDNTLIGWKENFNMAFQAPVPAQGEAKEYLEDVASKLEGPLWVGGHSKGGNLAVYAVMETDFSVRDRVVRCFSHDGPGFTKELVSKTVWQVESGLVDKTLPQESIIGLLLEDNAAERCVVQSTKPGIMQHTPFSWVVEGDDFATMGSISYDAYKTDKRLSSWLAAMSNEDRERFVELLYKLVQAAGEVTFSGLTDSLKDGSLSLMLKRLDGMPEDDRKFFTDQLEELVATMLIGPAPSNPQTAAEMAQDAADKMDDITAKFNDRLSELERRTKQ